MATMSWAVIPDPSCGTKPWTVKVYPLPTSGKRTNTSVVFYFRSAEATCDKHPGITPALPPAIQPGTADEQERDRHQQVNEVRPERASHQDGLRRSVRVVPARVVCSDVKTVDDFLGDAWTTTLADRLVSP